jgi:hypothetical protein
MVLKLACVAFGFFVHRGLAAEPCYYCPLDQQFPERCGPLMLPTTKWCDAVTNDDEAPLADEVSIEFVCCASGADDCCEVDGMAIFGIILLVLATVGGSLWYYGKCPQFEKSLVENIDHACDDICAGDMCLSRDYKVKVGMEKDNQLT